MTGRDFWKHKNFNKNHRFRIRNLKLNRAKLVSQMKIEK